MVFITKNNSRPRADASGGERLRLRQSQGLIKAPGYFYLGFPALPLGGGFKAARRQPRGLAQPLSGEGGGLAGCELLRVCIRRKGAFLTCSFMRVHNALIHARLVISVLWFTCILLKPLAIRPLAIPSSRLGREHFASRKGGPTKDSPDPPP